MEQDKKLEKNVQHRKLEGSDILGKTLVSNGKRIICVNKNYRASLILIKHIAFFFFIFLTIQQTNLTSHPRAGLNLK